MKDILICHYVAAEASSGLQQIWYGTDLVLVMKRDTALKPTLMMAEGHTL